MDVFEKKLDLAHEAAVSARRACITLTIVGVMLFSCIWNSRETSWENSFVHAAGVTLAWERLPEDLKAREPPEDEIRLAAERFVRAYGRLHPDRLESAIAEIQKSQVEHSVYFGIPFFDIEFHMNDLGILGGLSLFLVLVWLSRALVAFDVTLEEALKSCGEDEEKRTLARLNAQPVLPLEPQRNPTGVRTTTVFVVSLSGVCCLLQSYVVYSDYQSRGLAEALSPTYAATILWFGGLLSLISWLAAGYCTWVAHRAAKRLA